MSANTPLPWHESFVSEKTWHKGIYSESGEEIALIKVKSALSAPRRDTDAAFIVRACNSHDELLAALQAMVKDEGEHSIGCKEYPPGFDDSKCCPVHIARAAIQKATT